MDNKEFFDNFVANYPVYQTDRGFTILMEKFRDVFLKETYETIPDIFKKLYETGEIPIEIYDQILIDCGVSNSLLRELTNVEKLIFIKSLADFQKYKSTVYLVENIIKAYGDSFEAYELYVDYNKTYNRWECKPYPIYKPIYNDVYTRAIPYNIVYEKIPTLLINENHLNNIRNMNLAAFPLKTNIVFIASNYNQSITSYLRNLIISVFYKTYQDTLIDVNFTGETFKISLYYFVMLWMYVIFSKTPSQINNFSGMSINFGLDNISITIDELDSILEEYEQIANNTISRIYNRSSQSVLSTMDEFYYKYFHPLKSNLTDSDDILNLEKLRSIIKIKNSKLIDYVDSYINESNSNIVILISDLVKSIENYKATTQDINFVKYFKYFKAFLPNIDFLPSENTVYKILYYMKPFHTEFLDLEDLSMIYSNDKFNSVYFEVFYQNDMFFEHTDLVELEEHYYHNFFEKVLIDIAPISALMGKYIIDKKYEEINIDDEIIFED